MENKKSSLDVRLGKISHHIGKNVDNFIRKKIETAVVVSKFIRRSVRTPVILRRTHQEARAGRCDFFSFTRASDSRAAEGARRRSGRKYNPWKLHLALARYEPGIREVADQLVTQTLVFARCRLVRDFLIPELSYYKALLSALLRVPLPPPPPSLPPLPPPASRPLRRLAVVAAVYEPNRITLPVVTYILRSFIPRVFYPRPPPPRHTPIVFLRKFLSVVSTRTHARALSTSTPDSTAIFRPDVIRRNREIAWGSSADEREARYRTPE